MTSINIPSWYQSITFLEWYWYTIDMTIDILSITVYWLRLHNNSQSNLVVLFFPSLLKKKNKNILYPTSFLCLLRGGAIFLQHLLRDLTIQQRRRPCKSRWKQTSHHFKLSRDYPISSCYLKEGDFGWSWREGNALKFGQQMVEFIALPFPFPSKLRIWSFHVVVVQWRQRNVPKSVMHVQSCCVAH